MKDTPSKVVAHQRSKYRIMFLAFLLPMGMIGAALMLPRDEIFIRTAAFTVGGIFTLFWVVICAYMWWIVCTRDRYEDWISYYHEVEGLKGPEIALRMVNPGEAGRDRRVAQALLNQRFGSLYRSDPAGRSWIEVTEEPVNDNATRARFQTFVRDKDQIPYRMVYTYPHVKIVEPIRAWDQV